LILKGLINGQDFKIVRKRGAKKAELTFTLGMTHPTPYYDMSESMYCCVTSYLYHCAIMLPHVYITVLSSDLLTGGKDLTTQAVKDTQAIIEDNLGE
jgi:hypothetical protein